jgi:hypothetical protein
MLVTTQATMVMAVAVAEPVLLVLVMFLQVVQVLHHQLTEQQLLALVVAVEINI